MKHAGQATLESLAAELRVLSGLACLKERKPGIFYNKVGAYLHFHEDPMGVFADVKLHSRAFQRFPLNTPGERAAFLALVVKACSA